MEASIPLAQPDLNGNELKYVTETLRDGWVSTSAPIHKRFEDELTHYLGKPALATNCGTSAILLALMCAGVRPGDEVILPALTFGSVASAIRLMGASIVLADVDKTACLDPSCADRATTSKTRAIVPTHLYGVQAYVDYDLTTIEDSCEAFGIVPPTADYSCYSFFANKFITTGEGGCLIANGLELARQLRDGGFDEEYRMMYPGLNFCMSAMQAAVGVAQLERVHELARIRRINAARYAKRLRGFGHWLYVAMVNDPAHMRRELKTLGIETRRVFCPLHLSPAFRTTQSFPNAEYFWRHGLCLPTGPHVTPDQIDYISECIDSITAGARAIELVGASPVNIPA